MAVNFPQNPQVGELYTYGDRSWTWNGVFWKGTTTNVGYTGSRGAGLNLKGSVPTVQDLDPNYQGEDGDAFLVESNGYIYVWDSTGTQWLEVGQFTGYTGSAGLDGEVGYTGSEGESSFTWGDTTPSDPVIGDRWFDTITGSLAVYVDDGDSQQWVEVASSGFVGRDGYTGSMGTYVPRPIQEYTSNISENTVIPQGQNALSIGPLTIESGVSVSIYPGQRWIIL